ncbi:MAG: STAS domain-containing protein [Chitinispirillaceae bacterium]
MILSEALDITLEYRDNAIWFYFAGQFTDEQVPSIKEKFYRLIEDGNRFFVVDMEKVDSIDDSVIPMFLNLLNFLKGKGGELKLIFRNEVLLKAFQPYLNLFAIHPDADSLAKGTFLSLLKRKSRFYARKTGFRISRPVAIFMLVVLCGWFLTLLFTIHQQNGRIHEQQSEINRLTRWKQRTVLEMNQLEERIRPLEQLGILKDDKSEEK